MKTENKRQSLKIGSILVVLFLLIYIPSLFHWAYGKEIDTDIIKIDTIEDSINTDGILIRDEEVLESPFEGRYIPEVEEGEKVSANFSVATVLKDSSMKTLDEIKKLDEEILKKQKENGENQAVFSHDIVALDNEIADRVKELAFLGSGGSAEKYEDIEEQINDIIKKKAVILGGFGKADGSLNSLKQKRDNLQKVVDSSTKQIRSTSPGIISYTIDGLEKELTPSGIKSLTPEIFENAKVRNVNANIKEKKVEINKPFAKIIKGIDIYVAVTIDTKDADYFKVDKEIKLRINDINKVINGTVVHRSCQSGDKCAIVIRIDKFVNETSNLRSINVDLIKNSFKGLKIPVKSLIDIDEAGTKAKIVLVKANYASIREVGIVGRNGEFAIIKSQESNLNKGVNLYDTYVINPRNIEEGQLINQ
jgi:putative membrane fusion protein